MTGVDERLLVPATDALLNGWCGPCWWNGRAAIWGFGLIVNEDGSYHSAPARPVARGAVYLDMSRAEARDRVGRLLTRDDEHPEGWPARIQWDAGLGCWELWWVAEQLETRDVVYDLGVPWAALEGLTPEDEHAALAAVAREVFRG